MKTALLPAAPAAPQIDALSAYLQQQMLFYRHYVGMSDAMSDRGDSYGETESQRYSAKAADVLYDMQLVSADPTGHDLSVY